MREFVISVDKTCDLPKEFYEKETDLYPLVFSYMLDDTFIEDNSDSYSDFYEKVRNGANVSTTCINPDDYKKEFKKILDTKKDIIHLSFASACSSTCQNAIIAKSELEDEYEDARIEVIDSMSQCMGMGLLVYYSLKLKKEGKSFDEIKEWLENNRLRVSHDFTVDDLMYLYRGGRVTRGSAVVANALQVKPILHTDDNGKLVPVGKERGRKKSLMTLAKRLCASIESHEDENDIIGISHADSLEDAIFVRDKIMEMTGFSEDRFMITEISPIIGSHSGPGTVAVFGIGNGRNL